MKDQNAIALKEWAAVCQALETGRQTLVVRKGGIHEKGGEFRLAHREFWLFPTYEHQQRNALQEGDAHFFDETVSVAPSTETVRIGLYAVVDEEHQLTEPVSVAGLTQVQVLSEQTVLDRFHYRTPGLFVLVLRVYRRAEPYMLPNTAHYAGCRSWVDLEQPLSTKGLEPALDQHAFQEQSRQIRRHLQPTRYA